MSTFKPTEHLLDQPESHQPHYDKDDRVQPIDIIEQYGLDFYEASALKYLLRYKEKNGIEDLKKLQQYVHWLIARQRIYLPQQAACGAKQYTYPEMNQDRIDRGKVLGEN